MRLIGEKVFDPTMHLCEKCQYPILVYGRMVSLLVDLLLICIVG